MASCGLCRFLFTSQTHCTCIFCTCWYSLNDYQNLAPFLPCGDTQMTCANSTSEVVALTLLLCYLHSASWHDLFEFILSTGKILKDDFLFCYCLKASRIDSTKPPADAKQVCCLRCYDRGKRCLLLWSAVITFRAAVHHVIWQLFGVAVASEELTASQQCCCNPPGLPACCTVVVSDRGFWRKLR